MPLDMISDVMILRTTLRVIKSVVCRKAFDRIWSKMLSQISTLTPTVSVNEEVTPPTITIGVNGNEATADLPTGTSENWILASQEKLANM